MHKKADNVWMSALCEDAARLTKLETLQFDCSNDKVLPAQLIQVYSDRDQVPSWFMRRQRKARRLARRLHGLVMQFHGDVQLGHNSAACLWDKIPRRKRAMSSAA